MKHLRHFRVNEKLTYHKIQKITTLNNYGFYKSVKIEHIKENECLEEFDILNLYIDEIKKLFKGSYFRKIKNNFNMDIIKVSPYGYDDLIFSIMETDDEYFVVYFYSEDHDETYAKFLCDQIGGLMSLLNDLHKIIYS